MKLNLGFLCLSLAVALIFHQTKSANVEQQYCKRTTNGALCLSIIEADPRATLKTTPIGLCTILRDKALATAGATSAKISGLLKRATNPHLVSSLKTCFSGYSSAISSLKSVDFRVINPQTYVGLVGSMSDASDVPRDCELSFQEPPAIQSPISAENERLRVICATTMEMVNLVECNRPSFC
ncbi:pectinesterase inhibitor-like [Primulina eburnea]|uniref:pectinesterase inhibitor-like n=1 Tax=Primulina eburnea TaxID=1245227 RepID=UPI003C6CB1FD